MPYVAPHEIQLGIIPCAAGDLAGRRLGYGNGFYDRYLSHTMFLTVMLCREQRLVKEVPVDHWDRMMDMLVTEKAVYTVGHKSQK
jgi:5-formyltetrahydrofolate cyclo-ligase